jgi:hypothetical protein
MQPSTRKISTTKRWVRIDLRRLKAKDVALLAVVATAISAIIAATGAVSAAYVNGRHARVAAQDTARREYRLRLVQPSLTTYEDRFAMYHEVLSSLLGRDLTKAAAMLEKSSTSPAFFARSSVLITIGRKDISDAVTRLDEAMTAQVALILRLIDEARQGKDMKPHVGQVMESFADTSVALGVLRSRLEAFVFEM